MSRPSQKRLQRFSGTELKEFITACYLTVKTMIVGHMKVKFGLKSTLNRRNDRKCRFLIKLALLNGSFIEVISCRRLKGSKHGLENNKLYYQKHRHTFYSSRIFLDRKMLHLIARFSLLQRAPLRDVWDTRSYYWYATNASIAQFKKRDS